MCVKWTNQLDAMEYGILRAPRGRLFWYSGLKHGVAFIRFGIWYFHLVGR